MANWHEPHVSSTPPVEGDFDFVFDNDTGTITIVKLVSGAWVAQATISTSGLEGMQGEPGVGIAYVDPTNHGPSLYYLKVDASGNLWYMKNGMGTAIA